MNNLIMKQEHSSIAILLLLLLLSLVVTLTACQQQDQHGHNTVTDTDDDSHDSYSVKNNMSAVKSSVGAVVGAFVLPHGGIAFNPKHFNTTNKTALEEAWLLHDSARAVGDLISKLNPDLILLSTPHGIADQDNFLFYLNPKGYGSADTDNYAGPYTLSVNLDSVSSQSVAKELRNAGENISGLSAFGAPGQADDPFPLRWGEVIPLSFVSGLETMKAMIISQPSRRYNQSVQMIPELLHLGASLHQKLLLLRQRVVVIISADLAHTHDKNGPYGFSPSAEPFDQACSQWAATLDEEALLKTAAGYVNSALSCGYTGMVMLHGLMREASLSSWSSKVYANYHPSYYGMMVASFVKK
ncbi:protein TTE1956-like [Asterias rubens]|uniref:protein TTE1956-like n=1 Tax=Asterias rubens TaxID=7604 RepID=UPI0014551683|nr:protein TTE1956-like [Asterias rubens]